MQLNYYPLKASGLSSQSRLNDKYLKLACLDHRLIDNNTFAMKRIYILSLVLTLLCQVGYSQVHRDHVRSIHLRSDTLNVPLSRNNRDALRKQLNIPKNYEFRNLIVRGTKDQIREKDNLGYEHERYEPPAGASLKLVPHFRYKWMGVEGTSKLAPNGILVCHCGSEAANDKWGGIRVSSAPRG